jgi:hypothetical protein
MCGGGFLAMSALASICAVISSACAGIGVCLGFKVLSISVELVVASLGMAKGFVFFCFVFAKCWNLCQILLLLLKPAESSKSVKVGILYERSSCHKMPELDQMCGLS